VPTALLVGSGLAAKFGILPHGGGEAFQEMAQVDVVVFDKTGTLTEGEDPRVSDAEVLPLGEEWIQWNPRLVLGIAAEMESTSSHPLATAISNYCEIQKALPTTGSDFEEIPGRGIKGHFTAHNCTAIIGNEAWMSEHKVSIADATSSRLESWKGEAKSVVLLAIRQDSQEDEYRMAAIFAVSDPLRPEAQAVISTFHKWGIDTWMISGDNRTTALAVARTAGIPSSNVIAGVLPHEKVQP